MLKIMYGSITKSLELTDLLGKKFQNHTILKTKFVAETTNERIFCALVCDCNNPNGEEIHCLANIIYKCPSNKLKPHSKSNTRTAQKKYYRVLKNLTLNEDNWRQFVGSKKRAIELVLNVTSPY